MLSLFSANAAFQAPAALGRAANVRMESSTDMEDLAKKLNPVVGFWDPLGMVTPTIEGASSWAGQLGDEGAIGFLRHAEIKHGRVAMAAFVGYCVQANGICFPWGLTGQISFADIAAAGSPPAQWDALPTASKWQIFLFIGLCAARPFSNCKSRVTAHPTPKVCTLHVLALRPDGQARVLG